MTLIVVYDSTKAYIVDYQNIQSEINKLEERWTVTNFDKFQKK